MLLELLPLFCLHPAVGTNIPFLTPSPVLLLYQKTLLRSCKIFFPLTTVSCPYFWNSFPKSKKIKNSACQLATYGFSFAGLSLLRYILRWPRISLLIHKPTLFLCGYPYCQSFIMEVLSHLIFASESGEQYFLISRLYTLFSSWCPLCLNGFPAFGGL